MRASLAVVLLITCSAEAQITTLKVTTQACHNGSCIRRVSAVTAFNVGMFPDGDHLFVSAGHLRGEQCTGDSFTQPTEKYIKGQVIIEDDPHDATWLVYWTSSGVDMSLWKVRCTASRHRDSLIAFPIHGDDPEPGSTGTVTGIGTGGSFQVTVSHSDNWLWTKGRAGIPGDSGGPLIVNGSVVGILSGGQGHPGTDDHLGRFTPAWKLVSGIRRRYPSVQMCVTQKDVQIKDLPPIPRPPDSSNELRDLQRQLEEIGQRIKSLEERPTVIRYLKRDGTPHRTVVAQPGEPIDIDPIPVEIIDKRGEVIKDEAGNPVREWFPYGTPIRLQKYIVE